MAVQVLGVPPAWAISPQAHFTGIRKESRTADRARSHHRCMSVPARRQLLRVCQTREVCLRCTSVLAQRLIPLSHRPKVFLLASILEPQIRKWPSCAPVLLGPRSRPVAMATTLHHLQERQGYLHQYFGRTQLDVVILMVLRAQNSQKILAEVGTRF